MPLSSAILLRRALFHRRGRLAAALTCLTLSAALVTALLSLYSDLGDKLNRDFRAFGPNVVLTSHDGAALPENAAAVLSQQANAQVETVASAPVVAETAAHTPQVVVGTTLAQARTVHPEWKLTALGGAPSGTVPGWFGARVLEASQGPITLTLNGRSITFAPAFRLDTGGPEDAQIYIDAAPFAQWTGRPMTILEAHIPGSAGAVNAAVARSQTALPTLDVRPVRLLVEGQERVVARTHSLIMLSAVIVIATLAIAVLATLSAMVLDRRRDYAIMKAIGCSAPMLQRLFLMESSALAIAGSVFGLAVGVAIAFAVGWASFHTRIALHPALWPAAFAVNLLVALLAAVLPLQRLRAIQPAALLRGE